MNLRIVRNEQRDVYKAQETEDSKNSAPIILLRPQLLQHCF